jgi:hypothetical protein
MNLFMTKANVVHFLFRTIAFRFPDFMHAYFIMPIRLESDQLRSYVILSITVLKVPEHFFIETLIYQNQYFNWNCRERVL